MREKCSTGSGRVIARNVSMYADEWAAVDDVAMRNGLVTARGANTSLMLRQIVRSWMRHEENLRHVVTER